LIVHRGKRSKKERGEAQAWGRNLHKKPRDCGLTTNHLHIIGRVSRKKVPTRRENIERSIGWNKAET